MTFDSPDEFTCDDPDCEEPAVYLGLCMEHAERLPLPPEPL